MLKTWTFGRMVGVGYALAGVILLAIATVGYRSTFSLIESEKWLDHTQVVQRELANLASLLSDAESGSRGFVITGDPDFLQPYRDALPQIGRNLDKLRSLTADNPEQQSRLRMLTPLIDSKLAIIQKRIALRQSEGLLPAVKAVQTRQGDDIMTRIRALVDDLDRTESQLMVERERVAKASAAQATDVILWGGLAGVLLIGLIGWFTVRTAATKVGVAIGLVQSSSAELQAAANQQASGAKEQASAMAEIATTVRELLATSHQIFESARRVAQIAQETDTFAEGGTGTVESGNVSIAGIRRQVDLVVSHMLELGKKSQQIGTVLNIVTELAEQTNILAINATIEASGAGEAGSRFGVVADEIRKLADRTAGSAKEIRNLIEDIRTAVNTTVMATESGSKAVDEGAVQFTDIATTFRHISDRVSTATDAAREIELSTKQQATAVEQVDEAISNVAQTTKETEASSAQILQTASELNHLSRDLARLIRSEGAM